MAETTGQGASPDELAEKGFFNDQTAPTRRLSLRAARALAMAATLCFSHGCSSLISVEVQSAPVPVRPGLHAGAAQEDITPAPGLPLFGYSLGAEDLGHGYRGRLYARAIVFQRDTERLAIVQTDLGAMSGLVHRKVAYRTGALGITPDRLMIAATHTHAGPGGFFGAPFYNHLGAGRPGFERRLVDFLTDRIALAVERAVASLGPATLGTATGNADGRLAAIRSLQEEQPTPDTTMRVLRVDRRTADSTEPLAAMVFFPVHATSVSPDNDVYHGDLFAAASRTLANRVSPNAGMVAAFLNGAEGDVSPACSPDRQGHPLADELGERLAAAAYALYLQAGQSLTTDATLAHVYWERDAEHHLLCSDPRFGVPTIGGAEDGRSPLYGKLGVYEGHRRVPPKGCHTSKLPAVGPLQDLLMSAPPKRRLWRFPGRQRRVLDLPRVLPFQIMRIGDLTLATVPGEPTTRAGRDLATEIGRRLGTTPVIVGLANEYTGYFTTAHEYDAQHYEGSSTVYGPRQLEFTQASLVRLAERMAAGRLGPYGEVGRREFDPGPLRKLWKSAYEGDAAPWQAREVRAESSSARFTWQGRPARHDGPVQPLPLVSVECRSGEEAFRTADDDSSTRMSVTLERLSGRTWHASWHPAPTARPEECRFKVTGRSQSLVSDTFARPVGAPTSMPVCP